MHNEVGCSVLIPVLGIVIILIMHLEAHQTPSSLNFIDHMRHMMILMENRL